MSQILKNLITLLPLLISVQGVWAACESEIERGIRGDAAGRSKIIDQWKDYLTLSKNQLLQNVETERKNLNDARRYNYPGNAVAYYEMQICVTDAALNGVTPDGSRQNSRAQQSNQSQLGQNQQPQKIDQSTQQQVRESQQLTQQTQSRADQQRQGKRKTNDPAAQAHACIEIDKAGSGNFGAFKNTCNFKVNFSTCNYKPRTIQGGFNWSADFDCEKNQFGLHTPDGGRSVAAHNRNTEMVYWYACKAPATPVDAVFVVGKGIEARCH